ncbi:MAG TPA: VOC family protein [Candidatus Limnocylindrales bacterium]|nr:VOC family protein [Candidatus Limnocylindrales bacterium]
MGHGDFSHIEFPTDDLERARAFDEGLFGWSFRTMGDFPGYLLYETPGGADAVGGGMGIRGQTAGASLRNYVTVDSVEAPLAKVEGLGGRIIEPKAEVQGQGWYAVVADSEGNELGIWEALPR